MGLSDHRSLSLRGGGAVVMNCRGFRQEGNLPAGLLHAKAKVNIIEEHREAFIKDSNLLNDLPLKHEGGGHGLIHFLHCIMAKIGHAVFSAYFAAWKEPGQSEHI